MGISNDDDDTDGSKLTTCTSNGLGSGGRLVSSAKRTLKRVDAERRSKHVQKLSQEWSFSMSKKGEKKGYDEFLGNKKRKGREEMKSAEELIEEMIEGGIELEGVVKPKIKRSRMTVHSYKAWLNSVSSRAKNSNMLGERDQMSQGGVTVTSPNASDDIKDFAENVSSCSKKRQKLDFEQQCIIHSAKTGYELDGVSLPKDESESVSRHHKEFAKEGSDDAWGEESHLAKKSDGEHNECAVCLLGGELLCCKGKECLRKYHLSCLDPPFDHAPLEVWHCTWCVKKKMEFGVHSVTRGLESIWDVREAVSNDEAMLRQKEYFVKYQGLAHVHNRWIPETKLLIEAPELVAKFNRNKVRKWKEEWTVPLRLLQKRLISFGKYQNEHCHGSIDDNSDCQYEWLVRWTGLDYDQATWELENASFLVTPEAKKLKSNYELWHKKTERTSYLSQADEEGKSYISRLSELSSENSSGAYKHCQRYVYKLHEHWNRGQNAIVFDDHGDQERIVKMILFILSLQRVVLGPFLIICPVEALPVWEAEFLHGAPSANVVVYKGSQDVRHSIRSLEFYNEFGQTMFEVLLSSSNIVVEDMQLLKCVGWEAIIIDKCQHSCTMRHFEQFKILAADTRLLLVSTQIRDSAVDYLNLLSLLGSGPYGLNCSDEGMDSSTNINKLKERLAPYTAYECKSGSFRFEEYWVPVQLSNVQLEQYCHILLSRMELLCSCLRNDPTGALHEIIISTRKCCDHPYLLDNSLQRTVRNGLAVEEYLDAEIQLSGKLFLLHKMLREANSHCLRALIIFQSIGSGRDSVGHILEQFVEQKFGKDCYVRLDGGVYAPQKKQAALDMFNKKDDGKFVFLIENSACLPSIKLSSVDIVILFDSDWDPQNDLRALHKITIHSHLEQIKVFRLYSCYTLEEKVLFLAKEGATLEKAINPKNWSACHALLSWGASHLFDKLDKLHGCRTLVSGSKFFSEHSFLDNVLYELSTELPLGSGNSNPSNDFFISKVVNNGAYGKNASLVGEKEICLLDFETPSFWKNLLKGRHPRWHFLSESSKRARRKVQYLDIMSEEIGRENRVVKKSRKVSNNQVDPIKTKPLDFDNDFKTTESGGGSNQVNGSLAMHPVVDDIARLPEVRTVQSEEQIILPRLPQDTDSFLNQGITQLCDFLKLPETFKDTAVTFLDYIMKYYNVSWENNCSFQAFQISLCWIVASLLNHKINRKESLVQAKLHLKFDCEEDEANYICSKLGRPMVRFARRSKNLEIVKELHREKNSKPNTLCQQESEFEEQKRSRHSENMKLTPSKLLDLEEGELPVGVYGQCVSGRLLDLEEGQMPMNTNDAKSSKSTTTDQQDLEEGEIPVGLSNQQRELEEGEILTSLSHQNSSESTTFGQRDLEEGEILSDSQNRCLPDKLEDLERLIDWEEGKILTSSSHRNSSESTTFDQQVSEDGEILIGCQNHSLLSNTLEDLEEGELPISPQSMNCLDQQGPMTVDQEQSFGMLDNHVKDDIGNSNCLVELGETNFVCSDVVTSVLKEQPEVATSVSKDQPEVHRDKIDDSSCQVELHQANFMCSEVATNVAKDQPEVNRIALSEKITEKPDAEFMGAGTEQTDKAILKFSSQNVIPGTVQDMPLKIPNISLNVKELHSLPVGTVPINIESDAECDGEEEAIVSNSVPPTNCKLNDSYVRTTEIGSVMQPFEISQTQLNEVIVIDDALERVAHGMPSQKEAVTLERENLSEAGQNNGTVTPVLESARTSSSLVQQDHSAVPRNSFLSPIENHSSYVRTTEIGSAINPLGFSQTQLDEVIVIDDALESVAHDMPTQRESVALQKENLSEAGQNDRTVTPIFEFTTTSSPLVQEDHTAVPRYSFLVEQQLASAVPSSSGYNLPGIQCYQSSGRHSSTPEAQVSQQPSVGVPTDLFNPSVTDLTSMLVGGSDCRNDLDFRSSATVLGYLNNHPLHDNLVTPELPRQTCLGLFEKHIESIQAEDKEDLKRHDDQMMCSRSELERAIEAVLMKYHLSVQQAEKMLVQKRKVRQTNLDRLHANMVLAEVFNFSMAESWSSRQARHLNELIQFSIQQTSQMSPSRLGQCSVSPPMASPVEVMNHSPARLPASHAIPSFSLMMNPSSALRAAGHAVPCFSPMSSLSGNFQNGVVRAPGPHLRPSTSNSPMPTPDIPNLHNEMQRQPCNNQGCM